VLSPFDRPVICLVTDRRRLAPSPVDAVRALVAQVAGAARAGVDLVQVREPDLDAATLLNLTRLCVESVRGTSARVVVNDRLDVALAAGAHGVHLRAASFGAARVRPLVVPGFLIGRSVHSADEAQAAGGARAVDYLIAGALFESGSKPAGHRLLGLEAFGRLVQAAGVPVLGIGGLTPDRTMAVLDAGGAGVAGIGLFASTSGGDPGAAAAAAVRAVRAKLASARAHSSGRLDGDHA
jgi:thiamine-phosphate pyrophosphorylase